jgi:sialic acid synthase SpsE
LRYHLELTAVTIINRNIFDELFVLELANNHWGSVERGVRIIREFGRVARFHNIRAAIKLQLRDVDSFIHREFRERSDIRYVKKTLDTQLPPEAFAVLLEEVRRNSCIKMATPFDERSVERCVELGIEIIKLASSDINDWVLIEKIARTKKPVIASTGGSSLKDIDDLVTFFTRRSIPLALNHCVSLYPTEDHELELNQIDFLRDRYPEVTIGFSTHEYHDWAFSIIAAWAKGARLFERHIDIADDNYTVSPYCSTPAQIDQWFVSFAKAKEICGSPGTHRRRIAERERHYLDTLVRGVYAARDLPAGHAVAESDVYLAIPLQKGQLSCRELVGGEILARPLKMHDAVTLNHCASAIAHAPEMRDVIEKRGL